MLSQEDLVMIKGKRSKRPRPVSPLALTMATATSSYSIADHVISPSTLSNCEEDEEEDMANCLILLAKGHDHERQTIRPSSSSTPAHEVYQCKTCNKSFPSFQALGGHRASHKKPNNKPTTTLEEKTQRSSANQRDGDRSNGVDRDNTTLSLRVSYRVAIDHQNNKIRVHECSICGAEFGSGQALGGHMRRHRAMPHVPSSYSDDGESKKPRNLLPLDLNLPAPEDHDHQHHRESKLPFAPKEQVIVFSNSPLVDCLY